jgi:Holliday junction DNA helicase RuvA
MISYLKGKIEDIFFDSIVIEVNNIGYLVYVTKAFINQIEKDKIYKIYTTTIYKEDSVRIFGFKSKDERELFNLLYSVSGIGPKTALSILSYLQISEIIFSIYSNDTKKLSKIPGIGLKTAQRIILELKEKISTFKSEVDDMNIKYNIPSDTLEETEMTLLALGYSKKEIKEAIDFVKENIQNIKSSEDMIKEALIWLSNNYS